MKKIIGIILIITLVICSSTITLADEQNNNGLGAVSPTIPVSGHLNGIIGKVYSVDISWQSMEFKFTTTSATWDPGTHSFGSATGSWSVFDGSSNNINTITVTNHSNDSIKANLSYTPIEASVGGGFYDSPAESGGNVITSVDVPTAVGTTRGTAPTGNGYLRISGTPSDSWINSSGGTLGNITVTIATGN